MVYRFTSFPLDWESEINKPLVILMHVLGTRNITMNKTDTTPTFMDSCVMEPQVTWDPEEGPPSKWSIIKKGPPEVLNLSWNLTTSYHSGLRKGESLQAERTAWQRHRGKKEHIQGTGNTIAKGASPKPNGWNLTASPSLHAMLEAASSPGI